MARRRGTPSTPFAVWLDGWLNAHRDYTFKRLGAEIAEATGRPRPVTNGSISQWLSGHTKRIEPEHLRGLAIVTGEPLPNLERLAYGREVSSVPAPDGLVTMSRDELSEMLARAAELGAERALARLPEASPGRAAAGRASSPQRPPRTARRGAPPEDQA